MWNDIIKRAEQRGEFLYQDKVKARDWSTCAVGELIPKSMIKEAKKWDFYKARIKLTWKAWDLAMAFCKAVEANLVKDAREYYERIHSLGRVVKK